MTLKIIINDISKVSVDAIMNTINPLTVMGCGKDTEIINATVVKNLWEMFCHICNNFK